jgi:hypothetical protein
MRDLQTLLTSDYGLDLTGWTLTTATGVSADGLTIVGTGIDPSGEEEAWLARLDPANLPGDFDLDGDVDGVDFGMWQVGYPMESGATIADGDADGDGDVDGTDFGIWQAQYVPDPATIPVPEPASMIIALTAAVTLLRPKRKLC